MGNFGTDVFRMGEKKGYKIGTKIGTKIGARDANLRALTSMTKGHDFSLRDAMILMGLPLSDQPMYTRLLAEEEDKRK